MKKPLGKSLIAILLLVGPVGYGEEDDPCTGTPTFTVKTLVAALRAGDAQKAESMFVSRKKFVSVGGSDTLYDQARTAFEDSFAKFRKQDLAVEEIKFVRLDTQYCPEPVFVPKGKLAKTSSLLLYDNLHVIVTIKETLYSFKIDSLLLDDTGWRLVSEIGLLRATPSKALQDAARTEALVKRRGLPWYHIVDLNLKEVLQAPEGTVANLENLKGKVVVLEFWATWCGPCIKAIPHLNKVAKECEGDPIQFIAITHEEKGKVQRFLRKTPINAWIGIDNHSDAGNIGATHKAFGVNAIPHTVVIDQHGMVVSHTHPSLISREGLLSLIKERQ